MSGSSTMNNKRTNVGADHSCGTTLTADSELRRDGSLRGLEDHSKRRKHSDNEEDNSVGSSSSSDSFNANGSAASGFRNKHDELSASASASSSSAASGTTTSSTTTVTGGTATTAGPPGGGEIQIGKHPSVGTTHSVMQLEKNKFLPPASSSTVIVGAGSSASSSCTSSASNSPRTILQNMERNLFHNSGAEHNAFSSMCFSHSPNDLQLVHFDSVTTNASTTSSGPTATTSSAAPSHSNSVFNLTTADDVGSALFPTLSTSSVASTSVPRLDEPPDVVAEDNVENNKMDIVLEVERKDEQGNKTLDQQKLLTANVVEDPKIISQIRVADQEEQDQEGQMIVPHSPTPEEIAEKRELMLHTWEILWPVLLEAGFMLDEKIVASLDATCKTFFELNSEYCVWKRLGERRFYGIELSGADPLNDGEEFVPVTRSKQTALLSPPKLTIPTPELKKLQEEEFLSEQQIEELRLGEEMMLQQGGADGAEDSDVNINVVEGEEDEDNINIDTSGGRTGTRTGSTSGAAAGRENNVNLDVEMQPIRGGGADSTASQSNDVAGHRDGGTQSSNVSMLKSSDEVASEEDEKDADDVGVLPPMRKSNPGLMRNSVSSNGGKITGGQSSGQNKNNVDKTPGRNSASAAALNERMSTSSVGNAGIFSNCPQIANRQWRQRFFRFKRRLAEFRVPHGPPMVAGLNQRIGSFQFQGYRGWNQITKVLGSDEVAYTKGTLQKGKVNALSLYVEIAVTENADNLSLAIVDFDKGGKSSVTFSPDTGAVIKETKVQEAPRKVLGSYIQPLERKLSKFKGKMGMLIREGHLAFYRKYESEELTTPWECTGFVVSFDWAEDGNRLTPCIAFRDNGTYHAKISAFDSTISSCSNGLNMPPIEPEFSPAESKYLDKSRTEEFWNHLNWEATQD